MDRYRVELSLNVWSDTDKGAVKVARDICDKQKEKFDNRCEIIKVYRQEVFNEQSTQ
jgi:hypothetical protein